MRVIGLMSGTSADAIDAALVEWPDDGAAQPFRLLAFVEEPLEPELQARIHALAAGRLAGSDVLAELAALDVELGERFAATALEVARRGDAGTESIAAVASHGQTVAHHPERRATLQIGDPSVIAERTGWTTVADFRARDLAAGGEGAPLAPFFHYAVFTSPDEPRVVLNLGGIANVTWLPRAAAPTEVTAFDVGPANVLVDSVTALATQGAARFDRDGERAGRGRVDASLLERLLDDDYLRRPPPKSTGRELYGPAEAEELLRDSRVTGRSVDDLLATLVAFSAEAVARACRDFLPTGGELPRLLVCGGGGRNPVLLAALRDRVDAASVEPVDAHGVPGDAVEAMAFSLLGRNALLGVPNHLPPCTGARRAAVLGEIVPGGGGRVAP